MKSPKRNKLKLAAIIASLLAILVPSAAYAAVGTTVSPTSLRFSVSQQQTVDPQTILVKNSTPAAQTYKLFIVDVDTESGSLLPLPTSSQLNQKIFTLSQSEFRLQPEQSINVIVTANNIQELSAGGYYAQLNIQQANSNTPKQSSAIVQSVGIGLFLVKEDGAFRNVVLQKNKYPRVWFTVPKSIKMNVTNGGNTDVVPRGFSSVLKDKKVISKSVINENSVALFEGKSVEYDIAISPDGFMFPGRYEVVQSLRYEGQTDQIIDTQFVWYIPFWSVVTVLLFVSVLIVVRKKRNRKKTDVKKQTKVVNNNQNKAMSTIANNEAAAEIVTFEVDKNSTDTQIENPVTEAKIITVEDRATTAVRSHGSKKTAKAKSAKTIKKASSKSKKTTTKKSSKKIKNK